MSQRSLNNPRATLSVATGKIDQKSVFARSCFAQRRNADQRSLMQVYKQHLCSNSTDICEKQLNFAISQNARICDAHLPRLQNHSGEISTNTQSFIAEI